MEYEKYVDAVGSAYLGGAFDIGLDRSLSEALDLSGAPSLTASWQAGTDPHDVAMAALEGMAAADPEWDEDAPLRVQDERDRHLAGRRLNQ